MGAALRVRDAPLAQDVTSDGAPAGFLAALLSHPLRIASAGSGWAGELEEITPSLGELGVAE